MSASLVLRGPNQTYYMAPPPPPPPAAEAVPDAEAVAAVIGNMDISTSTGSSSSGGRARAAVDDLAQGISQLVLGAAGEHGIAITKTLAGLAQTGGDKERQEITGVLAEQIASFVDVYAQSDAYGECPAEDCSDWVQKQLVGRRAASPGERFWNVRDPLARHRADKAYIVDEHCHAKFPKIEARIGFYNNIFVEDDLLEMCTMNCLSFAKNGSMRHDDFCFAVPNASGGTTTFQCTNVWSFFETFKNSNGKWSHLHLGTANMTVVDASLPALSVDAEAIFGGAN